MNMETGMKQNLGRLMQRTKKEFTILKEDERGLGTLEIVIIIAVLLAVALLFRENIMSFASDLISKVFNFSVLDGL